MAARRGAGTGARSVREFIERGRVQVAVATLVVHMHPRVQTTSIVIISTSTPPPPPSSSSPPLHHHHLHHHHLHLFTTTTSIVIISTSSPRLTVFTAAKVQCVKWEEEGGGVGCMAVVPTAHTGLFTVLTFVVLVSCPLRSHLGEKSATVRSILERPRYFLLATVFILH